MITAKHVRELVTADPLRPFRIQMSDGSQYDVVNRDMAIVEKNTVDIGMNVDPDGIADGLARCSILHIVKLVDLGSAMASK